MSIQRPSPPTLTNDDSNMSFYESDPTTYRENPHPLYTPEIPTHAESDKIPQMSKHDGKFLEDAWYKYTAASKEISTLYDTIDNSKLSSRDHDRTVTKLREAQERKNQALVDTFKTANRLTRKEVTVAIPSHMEVDIRAMLPEDTDLETALLWERSHHRVSSEGTFYLRKGSMPGSYRNKK